jgi:hypothetical protein
MKKYKITRKDTREISKLITGIVGKQYGVTYECNLWVQPEKPNEPYTTVFDHIRVADLHQHTYEEIVDEDGALDCYTYHYQDGLEETTYISIKRINGEWVVNKTY